LTELADFFTNAGLSKSGVDQNVGHEENQSRNFGMGRSKGKSMRDISES
jgi:hypothetical protein